MKVRPLGWELTTVWVTVVALSVSIALGFMDVAEAILFAVAVITPLVLLSAGIRVIAGIVAEDRRYRRSKALRRP